MKNIVEFKKETMIDSLYTSLNELGLSKQEINLYSISLSMGPSPIAALAKQLQISRPNVYKLIKGLETAGLARFSEKEKFARTFMVESPALVLEKIRQKQESLSQLDYVMVNNLPDLLSLYQQGGRETKIRIFQGRDNYLKIHNMIIEQAGEKIEFLGSVEDYFNYFSDKKIENIWMKKRIKKGIQTKALLLPSLVAEQMQKNDRDQLRETRILKSDLSFVTSFQLFSNKVAIWQPETPLVILIEDEYIVAMFKAIFYSLWDISQ